MVDIIKPKRSSTASSVPTTGDLQVGEIAINLADRLLYVRDASDNIVTIDIADLASFDTGDLTEGSNLYYTDARVIAALSGGTGVTFSGAGEISIGQDVATDADVTFNDVVVDGNLTVNGTTTTVNSTEVEIGDNKIILNANETGSPTQDGGFEVERGTSTNVSFVWDETADKWTVGSATLVAGTFEGDLTGTVSDISNHDTDDLSEGATNLYYTDTRANAAIDARVDKTFVDNLNVDADTLDSQNGTYYLDYTNFTNTPTIASDTDGLTEGVTNLYFTNERVDDRVNALLTEGTNVSLTYDDGAGTLTVALDNTGGLPLANNDTDDLSEGATNLYYTQARVQTEVDSYVDKTFVDALNVDADTLDSQNGTYYLDYTNFTNTPTIPSSTTDITEGTNLYFTDERVDDRVNALLVEGTGITLNYDDGANSLTISASGGYEHIETLTLGSNSNTFEASTGLSAYRNVRFGLVADGPVATNIIIEARATSGTWREIIRLNSAINTNGGIAFGEINNFNDADGSHMRIARVTGGLTSVNFSAGDGTVAPAIAGAGWAIRDEVWDEFRIRLGSGNMVAGSLLKIEGQS